MVSHSVGAGLVTSWGWTEDGDTIWRCSPDGPEGRKAYFTAPRDSPYFTLLVGWSVVLETGQLWDDLDDNESFWLPTETLRDAP